jgi:hypothetical protein
MHAPLDSAAARDKSFCRSQRDGLPGPNRHDRHNINNGGHPIGVSYGPSGEYQFGNSRPQVYQFLSSRKVGEIVSSDAHYWFNPSGR